MDLSQIVSVSGYGGLFKVISQIKNGIIVESLDDQKRMPVYASQKVVALDDISIYTYSEDVPLRDVLLTIQDKMKGASAPEGKASNDELKAFMEKVMPEYDQDRVYTSDIKKLAKWYNILNEKGLITKEEEEKEKKEEKPAKEKAPAADKKKAAAKTAKPKPTKTSAAKPKGAAKQAKPIGTKKGA